MKRQLFWAAVCGFSVFASSTRPDIAHAAEEAAPTTSTPPATTAPRAPIEGGDAPDNVGPGGEPTTFEQGVLFPYKYLDQAMAGNVDLEGNVNYVRLKDSKPLNWFLKAVATADLKAFPVFDIATTDPKTGRDSKIKKDRTVELAFWINAHNAHMLSAIAAAYPIKSIDDIKDFDTARTRTVAGKNYSFKELREKVAEFGDPRALFALTTGTKGGFLPFRSAARFRTLNSDLNAAIEAFVNDPRNVSVSRIQNLVTVSSVFRDVSDLFSTSKRRKHEGIRMVLAGYTRGGAHRGYFSTSDYRIEFKDADRTLNILTNRGEHSGGMESTN